MFARQPGHFPILAVGQRAVASWLRGGLNMAPPQPNKVSGFFRTAANQRCGLAKPAVRTLPAGENPNKVSADSVSQPDSASEGGRLHRATVFFPVILVDYAI
tara:strand:+ start:1571 stop:1876 length:306 start_codon:yes stop_codon:yes gene_type:complete